MKRKHRLAATLLVAVVVSFLPAMASAADTYPDPALSIQVPPGKLYGGEPVTIGARSSVRCSALSITFLGDTVTKKGSSVEQKFDTPVVTKVTPEPVSARCTYTDASGASATVTGETTVSPAAFVGPLAGAARQASATVILLPRPGADQGSQDAGRGILPNTGGLPFWLLVAGLVLVLGGGVVAARRRRAWPRGLAMARRGRRLRRLTRRVGLDDVSPRQGVITLVVTLFLLALVVFVWQAARAAIAIDQARAQSSVLLADLARGNTDDARATTQDLQKSTAQVHGYTSGPLWAVASYLPLFGDDVRAMRTVGRELDAIAQDAVPPVVDVSQKIAVQTFTPRNGKIDLASLRALRPALGRADTVLAHAHRELAKINTHSLVGRLRRPVARISDDVATGAFASSAAHDAAVLLPDMLGGQGTKRYLLVVQNNAEVRATGGLPGSLSVITARNGKLTMGSQGGTATIKLRRKPVVQLTDDEKSVFSTAMATDYRDSNFTPDFPRTAQIISAFASPSFKTRFDGVISVDPVTLGYLLGGVGPVTLDDGTQLTAANAVDELLHGVYVRYPTDLAGQDKVFADAARAIFDAMVAGTADAQQVVEGLVRSAQENRVLVWSKDPTIERAISRTGLSGALPVGGRRPAVGVYLNDSTGAKMQYYLESTSALRSARCVDGKRQELSLRTSLTSTAPPGASRLPLSVTGLGTFFPRGVQGVNVRVFAPTGGSIESIAIDGKSQVVSGGRLDGRQVAVVPVRLAPGQDVTVTATILTGRGATGRAILSTTPGIEPSANDVSIATSCG